MTEVQNGIDLNYLPHMPILGSSNSVANKDMMSKILTNGDTIFWWSRKHCGRRRNCSLPSWPSCLQCFKMSIYGGKG